MSRLRGMLLIGNTLMPAIVVISVVAIYLVYEDEAAEAWRNTESALHEIVDTVAGMKGEIEAVAESTKQEADQAVEDFRRVKSDFDRLYNDVKRPFDLAKAVTVQTIEVGSNSKTYTLKNDKTGLKITSITVKVPKVTTGTKYLGAELVKPFNDAFGVAKAAVVPLSNFVESVDEDLEEVRRIIPAEARRVQAQTAIVAEQILSVVRALGKILTVIGYVAVALVLWFAISYVSWAHERLIRGWTMLRAEPAR